MYFYVPDVKCSKCGATNSETFQRPNITGRRCLSCGHEHKEEKIPIASLYSGDLMSTTTGIYEREF